MILQYKEMKPLVPVFLLAVLLALTSAQAPENTNANSKQVAIYITVEPENAGPNYAPDPTQTRFTTIPGLPVQIRGVATLTIKGQQLRITIATPKSPVTLNVTVNQDGKFETTYTPATKGIYNVTATDASVRFHGETSFEAKELAAISDEFEQDLKKQATGLVNVAHQFTDALEQRIKDLPESPAKDETIEKTKKLKQALNDTLPTGKPPDWVDAIPALRKLQEVDPSIVKATEPLVQQLASWKQEATSTNQNAPRALAELTHGNVVCDQLDAIINGFKFVDFVSSLATKPEEFLSGWLKQNVPTKLASMIPAVRQSTAVTKNLQFGWNAITSLSFFKNPQGISVPGGMSIFKIAIEASNYVASGIFAQYCEQFQGSISGTMTAHFFSNGQEWWNYKIAIQGQLILRYPKNASAGSVALTGEFIGNGTSFHSWDNAIPVLFPTLAASTVFRKWRHEPFGMSDVPMLNENPSATVAGQPIPNTNPLSSTIQSGGQIAQLAVTPAFFKIPVRGDMSGNAIRLEVQNAIKDFDDVHTKVFQLMLPVLSVWPTWNEYELPYKGARFMIFRAMNDSPASFQIRRQGKIMVIEQKFHRDRPTPTTKGIYDLSIKACNPACS